MVAKPDVYKHPNSDTHVIFGEAKIEDLSAAAQAAAQQFSAEMPSVEAPKAKIEEEDEGEVDETGVEPKDIELVMTQAGVSRGKAVNALKSNDGDIVSAIMDLTMLAVCEKAGEEAGWRVFASRRRRGSAERYARAFSRFQCIKRERDLRLRLSPWRHATTFFTPSLPARRRTSARSPWLSLVDTTPLAYFFLVAFAARAASSAAMAACT